MRENLRHLFKGTFIANCNLDLESGTKVIEDGHADLCSFGRLYVCNDNLVERFKTGAPLNGLQHVKDQSKLFSVYFYGNGALGYTDLSVYSPDQQ